MFRHGHPVLPRGGGDQAREPCPARRGRPALRQPVRPLQRPRPGADRAHARRMAGAQRRHRLRALASGGPRRTAGSFRRGDPARPAEGGDPGGPRPRIERPRGDPAAAGPGRSLRRPGDEGRRGRSLRPVRSRHLRRRGRAPRRPPRTSLPARRRRLAFIADAKDWRDKTERLVGLAENAPTTGRAAAPWPSPFWSRRSGNPRHGGRHGGPVRAGSRPRRRRRRPHLPGGAARSRSHPPHGRRRRRRPPPPLRRRCPPRRR